MVVAASVVAAASVYGLATDLVYYLAIYDLAVDDRDSLTNVDH